MMAGGLHSGLAIKRQRKRRMDQLRARERRYSTRSNESGLGSRSSVASTRIARGFLRRKKDPHDGAGFDSNVGIGMLHIGIVFCILGAFLLGSGLLPDDFGKFEWTDLMKVSTWWNELVITGGFSLLLGVFLVILDKFITKREEEELEDYVQRQLTRSKSGHALVRDVETGNLTTKRSKSSNAVQEEIRKSMVEDIPEVHLSPVLKSPPANYGHSPSHFIMNGDAGLLSPQLEKIMEEDNSDRGMNLNSEDFDSTTASLSPGSPCESQELLNDMPLHVTTVPSKYHQVRMTKI